MSKLLKCPGCGSEEVWCKGIVPSRKGNKRRCICKKCGTTFYPTTDLWATRIGKETGRKGAQDAKGGAEEK